MQSTSSAGGSKVASNTTEICAHRGGNGDQSENWNEWPPGFRGENYHLRPESVTPEERRSAWENKITTFMNCSAKAWELDIWLSNNDVPVVNHDGNLQRTHGIDKRIGDLTTEELAVLDPSIMPLINFLGVAKQKSVETVLIEAKAGDLKKEKGFSTYDLDGRPTDNSSYKHNVNKSDLKLAQIAADIVSGQVENGNWKSEQLHIIGFIHDQLQEARTKNPGGPIGYSFSRKSFGYSENEMNKHGEALGMNRIDQMIAIAKNGGASSINPDYRYVSSDFVEKAHAAGLKVRVWTVNEQNDIQKMLTAGVDTLITDMPVRAERLLKGKARASNTTQIPSPENNPRQTAATNNTTNEPQEDVDSRSGFFKEKAKVVVDYLLTTAVASAPWVLAGVAKMGRRDAGLGAGFGVGAGAFLVLGWQAFASPGKKVIPFCKGAEVAYNAAKNGCTPGNKGVAPHQDRQDRDVELGEGPSTQGAGSQPPSAVVEEAPPSALRAASSSQTTGGTTAREVLPPHRHDTRGNKLTERQAPSRN